jgi:hypothetical protein
MTRLGSLLFLAATLPAAFAQSFAGRWDLTFTSNDQTYPGWLEVIEKTGGLEVRVQPRAGSVRPVKEARIESGRLILPLSPANAKNGPSTWEITKPEGNNLTGVVKRGDTVAGRIKGVRAPTLLREPPKSWSKPIPLFDGKDLTGWEPLDPKQNHWTVQDGLLVNQEHGSNLKTVRQFEDFKLHFEVNCPDKGNSGFYLRGRYEVQIEYEPHEDDYHRMGSIYGYVAATGPIVRKPGEWETFDITLVGRRVTITRNGVITIKDQEIPGITGGALDSNEEAPGPFYIQGDHTAGIKFRKITVSVPNR